MREKELYLQEVKKIWSEPKMIDYCMKKAQEVVELSNGHLLVIEKPRIKKDFCFSETVNGYYDQEKSEKAYYMSLEVKKNPNYFLESNLREIKKQIDVLRNRETLYIRPEYNNTNIYCWCGFYYPFEESKIGNEILLFAPGADRDKLIAAYERVLKDFEKRLQTYLKRYGLSKINSWTYMED